ncbi:hypothetical protein ACI2KR_30465 [Pseudomonas luteola]
MARIHQLLPGQLFWTMVINGEVCQRVYKKKSEDHPGHILMPPSQDSNSGYYVENLFAYEHKSDILAIHVESAKKQLATAQENLDKAIKAYEKALQDEATEDDVC